MLRCARNDGRPAGQPRPAPATELARHTNGPKYRRVSGRASSEPAAERGRVEGCLRALAIDPACFDSALRAGSAGGWVETSALDMDTSNATALRAARVSRGDRLDVLAPLVDAYERDHFPVQPSTPLDMLRYAVGDMGRTQTELADVVGSRSLASQLLSGRRRISLDAAQKISAAWDIPIQLLVTPYAATAAQGALNDPSMARCGSVTPRPARAAGTPPAAGTASGCATAAPCRDR